MAPCPPPNPWKNQRIRGARIAWAPKKEIIKQKYPKITSFMLMS